jgi:hypothetical protein
MAPFGRWTEYDKHAKKGQREQKMEGRRIGCVRAGSVDDRRQVQGIPHVTTFIFGITGGNFNWNCMLGPNRDLGTFVKLGFSPNPPLLCKPRDRRASDGFIMFAEVARQLSNIINGKNVPIYLYMGHSNYTLRSIVP